MDITHKLLLSLGFTELFNRQYRYVYKGVTGRLTPELNTFHFHGYGPSIETKEDLRYMLMLIDYQHQATYVPYPIHDN